MDEPVRFYFDQHYPDPVVKALRQRGINVLTAQEAGRCGLADTDQLKFATANERVMVTFDPDFLALHSSGMQHAGIAWSHMLKYSIGQLIFMLVLLHAALDREDMKKRGISITDKGTRPRRKGNHR